MQGAHLEHAYDIGPQEAAHAPDAVYCGHACCRRCSLQYDKRFGSCYQAFVRHFDPGQLTGAVRVTLTWQHARLTGPAWAAAQRERAGCTALSHKAKPS